MFSARPLLTEKNAGAFKKVDSVNFKNSPAQKMSPGCLSGIRAHGDILKLVYVLRYFLII